MNRELIQRVREAIKNDPMAFDMREWGPATVFNAEAYEDYVEPTRLGDEPDCETPACLAGWAIYLHGNLEVPEGTPARVAGRIALGVTSEQADDLFESYWPDQWLGVGEEALMTTEAAESENWGTFTPDADDAYRVLGRLLDYGFAECTS